MTGKFAQKSVATRFSAAANTYNRHAKVQSEAASGLTKLVSPAVKVSRILEIGCGTGILTAILLKQFPSAEICALDISEGMTNKSRKRLGARKGIKWITCDFRELNHAGKFDLVTSSSSLHWITPLRNTFRKIAGLLEKDGILAFSVMLKGTLGEIHAARRKTAPSKKVPQQLPTRREVLDVLRSCGFKIAHKRLKTNRSTFSSASQLLKSLHEQGVTSGPFASGTIPLNRSELQRLVSYYNIHYKCSGGGVFATYKVLYIVAKRK